MVENYFEARSVSAYCVGGYQFGVGSYGFGEKGSAGVV